MKHASTKDISEFIDGTLSVSRMRAVGSHFSQCEACRREYEAWKSTRALLRRSRRPVAPGSEYWTKVLAHLDTDAANLPSPSRKFFTTGRSKVVGWSSALAAAAAVAGLIFFSGHLPIDSLSHSIPLPSLAQNSDSINDADMFSFLQAHTEAAAAQPLSDGSHQVMLAADIEGTPNDYSSGEESAAYVDSDP